MHPIYAILILLGTGLSQGSNASQASARAADNLAISTARGDVQVPPDEAATKADKKLSADIRKAISSGESLSKIAQNIRIIVRDGAVTLRGLVYNSVDKTRLGELAQLVPNVRTLENRILVKTVHAPSPKSYLTEATNRRPASIATPAGAISATPRPPIVGTSNFNGGHQLPEVGPLVPATAVSFRR